MYKRFLLPLALILLLLLAACGAETAEPAATPAQESMSEEPMEGAAMEEMDGEMESDDGTMDGAAEAGDDMMDDDAELMEDDDHDGAMDGDEMMAEDGEAMEGEGQDDAMESDGEEMMGDDGEMDDAAMLAGDLPDWQTLPLTNAATGETFTLADFQGKTVFVEPMATWCSNCMQQQRQVVQARGQLGEEVVFVGLSLETTLPDGDLARYAQDNGFDWTYAVMSNEVLAALADQFGRSITSAPSTPHFIVRPDGSFSELSTGIHSADEIVAQVEEAQS